MADEFSDVCDAIFNECPESAQYYYNSYYNYANDANEGAHRHLGELAGANADDATWILTSSFVILTMQTGFALLETGSCQRGYEVNILMKNVVDVLFGSLAYYLIGYAFSFGSPSNWFIGYGDFAPHSYNINEQIIADDDDNTAALLFDDDIGNNNNNITAIMFNDTISTDGEATITSTAADGVESGAIFSRFLFQLSFAATATTIVSGCVAMRMHFFIYCFYAFYAVLPYSVCAHWFLAPTGWLKKLGTLDFAGGGPVHLFGAMNGLIAILILGARTGRFDAKVDKRLFQAVSPTDTLFGLFMLWWGWIGFNCGSSFGITDTKWIVATRAAITTINASAGGGIMGIIYSLSFQSSGRKKRRNGQYKPRHRYVKVYHVVNAILGGLVAITPACAYVRIYNAFVIGAVGALIALMLNQYILNKLHLDDPVGAIGVHGGGAMWGLIANGLFVDKELPGIDLPLNGLFHGGGFQLLGYQAIAIGAVLLWSLCATTPFFYIVGSIAAGFDWKNPRKGLRVTVQEELLGADVYMHGIAGDDDTMNNHNNSSNRNQQVRDVSNHNSSIHDNIPHNHINTTTPRKQKSSPKHDYSDSNNDEYYDSQEFDATKQFKQQYFSNNIGDDDDDDFHSVQDDDADVDERGNNDNFYHDNNHHFFSSSSSTSPQEMDAHALATMLVETMPTDQVISILTTTIRYKQQQQGGGGRCFPSRR